MKPLKNNIFCGKHAPEDHRYNVEFYITKPSVQCSLPMCYMRDANWKKTVGIGEFSLSMTIQNSHSIFICIVQTLITKLKRSQIGLELTKPAFEQLNKSCLERKLPVHIWKLD